MIAEGSVIGKCKNASSMIMSRLGKFQSKPKSFEHEGGALVYIF